MTEDQEDWANDHGYCRYKCPECGRTFWTDGDPRGECCEVEGGDEEEEEGELVEVDAEE